MSFDNEVCRNHPKSRVCVRCGANSDYVMLAYRDGKLVCDDCDADLENEWVAEDPENNRHFLDTFSPGVG